MINVFRKIRRGLLSGDKISRYLIYATGEILLVVIGILIALQVNNWNQKRIENNLSLQYHQRFIEDLDRFIGGVESLKQRADRNLHNIVAASEMLKNGSITSGEESIFYDAIQYFFQYNYSNPDIPTLQEMKSNGELNLIYNIELRNQLIEFGYTVASVNDIYRSVGDAITNKLPVFDKYIRTHVDTLTNDMTFEYEFEKMAIDKEYINHFSRLGQQWRASAYFSKILIERALELKDRIKEEVNQLH